MRRHNPYKWWKLREALEARNAHIIKRQDMARAIHRCPSFVDQILGGTKWSEEAFFALADYLEVPREELIENGSKKTRRKRSMVKRV
jgi:hypothetical protein